MKPNEPHTGVVTILYFARLREVLEKAEEELVIPEGVQSIGDLTAFLRQRGGAWATELGTGKAVRVALNQDMAEESTPLSAGDEIAFFPPVTGG